MNDRFRVEIGFVLILKVALLTGLWFVVFRPEGKKPEPQVPIADRFFLNNPSTSQNSEEKSHDR